MWDRFYYVVFIHQEASGGVSVGYSTQHFFGWFNRFSIKTSLGILERTGARNPMIVTWHEISREEHIWLDQIKITGDKKRRQDQRLAELKP